MQSAEHGPAEEFRASNNTINYGESSPFRGYLSVLAMIDIWKHPDWRRCVEQRDEYHDDIDERYRTPGRSDTRHNKRLGSAEGRSEGVYMMVV